MSNDDVTFIKEMRALVERAGFYCWFTNDQAYRLSSLRGDDRPLFGEWTYDSTKLRMTITEARDAVGNAESAIAAAVALKLGP